MILLTIAVVYMKNRQAQNKKIISRLLLLFVFFSIPNIHSFAQDLILVKDKDGIIIYKEKDAHNNLNRIIASTVIPENSLKILSLICDAENHENWVYANHGAYILDSIDPYHWIYYSISKAPWPINNRDIVSSVELFIDNQTYTIRVESNGKPNLIPESPNMVRIPILHSKWVLQKIDDENTRVKLDILVDPGGNIPNWVINLFSANGPYRTLINMKNEVKKSKYQKVNHKLYQDKLQNF